MNGPYASLTIEQVARFPRPGMVVPRRIGFTPDGTAVTYLFSAEGSLVLSLWKYDIASGERAVIGGPPPASADESGMSLEEELKRERARLREVGVTDYHWAKKAPKPMLLVPGGGRLFVGEDGEALRELPRTNGATDPAFSSDGSRVAFARDGELFVANLDGGEPRQLTEGAEDGLTNGVAEFIAQEEFDQSRGFWWSDDGSRIAYIRADSRHIPEYPIVHQGRDAVEIERHRYPFAGQPNAKLQLGAVPASGGTTTWMDLGPDEDIYVPRAAWRPDGTLTAEILSRDQRTLRLLAFDPATGVSRLLLEERGEPWINVGSETRFLTSGEMLRSSERSGFRHLYLHDENGTGIRQLTAGNWLVSALLRVDEERRCAYFLANGEGPLEQHLYSVLLDDGETHRLTSGAGWHAAVVAEDGRSWVDVHSTREHAPSVTLRSMDGSASTVLFANEGNSAGELGLEPAEFLTITADDGTPMDAMVYRPPDSERGRRYPLVVSVYGGPHAQRVLDEWSTTVDLRAQYLAQQGFVVVKLDNRGSAGRGLAFEAHLDRRMGTVEVDDQVLAVRQLSALDYVDGSRVGIYGWSYGGYMTLLCMMKAPGVFKVGVAGAPVTHYDGYDTGYTERYMGTPKDNSDGYREGSVLAHVEKLRGKLLIVHGMVDENVHFRHTARLIVALSNAQKEFDLLIFPEERHMPRDAKGLEYQERRVLEYFVKNL